MEVLFIMKGTKVLTQGVSLHVYTHALIMHIGFLACFHAISLERSRHVIFLAPCSTEAVGIAHKPPRSL